MVYNTVSQQYFSYLAAASAPIHAFLGFPHNHCQKKLDSCERGLNRVAMTIINSLKEHWPSRGLNQRPPVLKSTTLPTELWELAKTENRCSFDKLSLPLKKVPFHNACFKKHHRERDKMLVTRNLPVSPQYFYTIDLFTTQSRLLTFLKSRAFENIVGKEKMLVTSIFSLSHNVFYSSQAKFQFFIHIYFVVCIYFQFGLV